MDRPLHCQRQPEDLTLRDAHTDIALMNGEIGTGILARTFERTVREAAALGAFGWIGIVSYRRDDRRAVDVYLSEHRGLLVADAEECAAEAVEAFENLLYSLGPAITTSLHLVDERDCPAVRLQEDVRRLCSETEGAELVWDELLARSAS